MAARDTCDMLRNLADGGRAVLLASHRLEELERIADDIAVLIDGRIMFLGSVEELRVQGDTIMTPPRAAARRRPPVRGAPMIEIARAVLRRDWSIERTYPLRLILVMLGTATFAAGLFFVGTLVIDPPALEGYSGGYFDFVIVGLAVTSFAAVGLQ